MKDKTGKVLTASQIMHKVLHRTENVLLEFEILLLHIAGYIPSHHVRRFFL